MKYSIVLLHYLCFIMRFILMYFYIIIIVLYLYSMKVSTGHYCATGKANPS